MTRTIARSARHAAPVFVLSALLLVLASPAAAETPARDGCGPGLAFLAAMSPTAMLLGPNANAEDTAIGEPGALSDCTAQCWDGSTVTCSGSSCNKQDSDCDAGIVGQCYGSATGTLSCPPCPSCTAECQDGTSVTCTGSSCSAQDANCSAGVRGYCTGTASGSKYCPACCDSEYCSYKNGTYCSGAVRSSTCTIYGGGCGNCFCDTSNHEWVCTL